MAEVSSVAPSPRAREYLARQHRNLIGGEWQPAASGQTLDVFDPGRGEIIARAPAGGREDIDRAVRDSRRSFDEAVWRNMRSDARARIMWRWADLIEQNADSLAEIETINNGMPLIYANFIVQLAAGVFRYYAGLIDKLTGSNASAAVSGGGQEFHAYTAKEPVGVAGLIVPWNGPMLGFAMKVAPALAAGCSCVLKPAEYTPLTAFRLAELALEAGLPPGVLNVVVGLGTEAGAALVEHPGVDKISFTGSTVVGKQIARAAAERLTRVTLELGGKSPLIVFDDADLEGAIKAAAMGIFANSGQACIASSRLFVHRKVYDKVLSGVCEIAGRMRLGHGLDPATELGPLISARQWSRVNSYIESGCAQGAELVAGGKRQSAQGYFVEPTIFSNTRADMRIVREEIFGPVLVATPFEDTEAVLQAANDTRYGLGAGIFTNDVNKAHRIASRLQAGTVWVNCYAAFHPSMPFGGFKESGWGREFGPEGLEAFIERKSVLVALR